jgi:hypothetical protein
MQGVQWRTQRVCQVCRDIPPSPQAWPFHVLVVAGLIDAMQNCLAELIVPCVQPSRRKKT